MSPVRSSDGSPPRPRPADTGDTAPAPDTAAVPLPPDEGAVGDPSWADDGPTGAHHDTRELAARFEDEKPGRVLGGPVGVLFTGATLAVALLALWQVFVPLPQGSKYYLIIFLAGVLPMVFLAYPADLRLPRRRRPTTEPTADDANTPAPAGRA
ncbi:MAG: C4-dicarboxylate ABC transporter permease, partial [Micromonospora sp.]